MPGGSCLSPVEAFAPIETFEWCRQSARNQTIGI